MKKNVLTRIIGGAFILTMAAGMTACSSGGQAAAEGAGAATAQQTENTAQTSETPAQTSETPADQAQSAQTTETAGDSAGQTEAGAEAGADQAAAGEVRKIKVVAQSSNFPITYTDDDGNWTGYEVEVFRKVDELLDQYEFEFVEGNDQTSNYTGVSTGKYQVVLSNAFYTDERAENYNLPENQLGVSPCGLIQRIENADITTLEQAAEAGQIFVPAVPGDGLTYQLEKYNKENPDKAQINFEYTDNNAVFAESGAYVAEGRYDTAIYPATYYEALVKAEDGNYHQYDSQLSFKAVIPVKTYAVVAKEETQLSDDISGALGQLLENGTLAATAQEFYGFNPFELNEQVEE